MRRVTVASFAVPLTFIFITTSGLSAQSAVERDAIVATALDYLEGWYEANPDRMARSVHADLAKRIVRTSPTGESRLDHMGKETLVRYTDAKRDAQSDVDLRDRITVLDVYGNAAVVRADADDWVDFLQVAKLNGRWVIVNVLWEMHPK